MVKENGITFYLKSFRDKEILIEYKNLQNPNHCPKGLYVIPADEDLHTWFGVLFIQSGYYKGGIFKFMIIIPESYPDCPPIVRFITDIFHPLVNLSGHFNIHPQFPQWRKNKDFICHLLHYVKNSFSETVLDNLTEDQCSNKEAFRIFKEERPIFYKLAHQCSVLSTSSDIVFDNFPPENSVNFHQLSDKKFEEIKSEILNSSKK